MRQAIHETLSCLSRDLGKDGITLTVDVPEQLMVAINAGQFQQVLMNLIVNARSSLLGGHVAAASPSRGGIKRLAIRGNIIKKGRIVEISVADTGAGIPEEVLPRIFDPFFSTKKGGEAGAGVEGGTGSVDLDAPRGGTGLGLTICQEIIASAGGTIRVQSEVGKGAIFIIELPVGEVLSK